MVDHRRVTDGEPCEKKDARDLLRKIAEGTHVCGDPGMQFDTTIHNWHTCKGTGRQNSTNPCSEYLFLDNTACNLASLNLMKFKREDGTFDVERFKAAVRIFITAQEIVVDNASYPTKEIAENSHIFRTLGLGYANLGALIMSYGYGYDSRRGPRPGRRDHLDHDRPRLRAERPDRRHHRALSRLPRLQRQRRRRTRRAGQRRTHARSHRNCTATPSRKSRSPTNSHPSRTKPARSGTKPWRLGQQHGYRNAQVTVLAPTGTIGFLMDCDTTGIEPDIALVKYKLLAGGGMLKIVNQTVRPALQNLGYSDAEIEAIIAHIDKFDTIEDVDGRRPDAPERTPPRALSGLRLRLQADARGTQPQLPRRTSA